jgi:hypothetical protein
MSNRDWKLVQVIVYPRGGIEQARMEETVQLPYDAGFDDLLAALADASPDVFEEVCGCVTRASARSRVHAADDPPLLTLDHYFTLGGPILCPDLPEGMA